MADLSVPGSGGERASRVVDEIVRGERGRIVAGLLRLCGNLELAEDAFQEAAVAALRAWADRVPDNPGAWLTSTARNAVVDVWRREKVARVNAPPPPETAFDPRETLDAVSDDHLRLILTCCHPALSRDNQIALTLKVVAGFSTEAIARAFLCSEDTISQRVLRARKTLAEASVGFEPPARDELGGRVGAALGVVYAIFNEGHTAHRGPLMRVDLQAEAVGLGRLLCDLVPTDAEAYGLLALMLFSAARAETRADETGLPILLANQDRSRWKSPLLREGLMGLRRARTLGGRGAYVLQAELAALHVTAPSWNETDWTAMVAVYDALADAAPSPVVSLNRAIALSMRDGPLAGLRALDPLETALADYHLFYATRSELLERAGEDGHADLERALELATNDGERRLLMARRERTGRAERDRP